MSDRIFFNVCLLSLMCIRSIIPLININNFSKNMRFTRNKMQLLLHSIIELSPVCIGILEGYGLFFYLHILKLDYPSLLSKTNEKIIPMVYITSQALITYLLMPPL